MFLVDSNVLIYAANRRVRHHAASRRWLSQALDGVETVGLAWVALLGFIRVSTDPRILPRPLRSADAVDLVRIWANAPASVLVEPTARHFDLLQGLLAETGTAGNLVNDAHLAALALEHAATVVTYDTDFERFGVPWERPSG